MFSGEHRQAIKQKIPGATVGEVAKQLGEAWGTMTPAQKKPYEVLAAKDRERYKREMEEYRRKGDDDDEEEEEEEEEEESDE